MDSAKRLVEELKIEKKRKIFKVINFPSRSELGKEYLITIYWGGTWEKGNMECTCPRFKFTKWCSHCDYRWNNEMTNFAKSMVIHHDEVIGKWKKK